MIDFSHFPIYLLMVLLIGAVIIPLLHKRFDRNAQRMLLGTMALALAFATGTLVHVYNNGAYFYNFGGWTANVGVQFVIDDFSALMTFVIVLLSMLIIIYSIKDIEHEIHSEQRLGYYCLVLLLVFSMVGITLTNDLLNLYIFMDILALSAYGNISIKHRKENLLASFRYLKVGTIGSISVLFGIALIYMVTGHLNMTEIYHSIDTAWSLYPKTLVIALGFILVGFGIKTAIFPLHSWLPAAHTTMPSPSSALHSSLVIKVYFFAIVKILFRTMNDDIISNGIGLNEYLLYFGAAGMIMGSVFAIGQKDIKRMLAYSSMAQFGYIFLGIGLATSEGLSAAFFHVISHALMKSALFLSAGAIIYKTEKRKIKDLAGIGYEMPITLAVFSIAALGMIGLPGLSGFMNKWYLALAVIESGRSWYLVIILLSGFLNAVYYLPIIVSAFLKPKEDGSEKMTRDGIPRSMTVPMMIIAGLILLLGIFPQIIMNIIERAVPTFL